MSWSEHPCSKCKAPFELHLLSACPSCMRKYTYCKGCGGVKEQVKDRNEHMATCKPVVQA